MRRSPLLLSVISALCLLAPLGAQARVIEGKTRPPVSRRTLREQVRQQDVTRLMSRPTVRRNSGTTTLALPKYGVQFAYPNDWLIDDSVYGTEGNAKLIVMLVPPEQLVKGGFRHNINLVIEDLSLAPLTLNQYSDEAIVREREFFSSFNLVLRDLRMIAGEQATVIRFDAEYNGVNIRYEQAWMIRGNEALVWTFADDAEGFDEHQKIFRALLDSLDVDSW